MAHASESLARAGISRTAPLAQRRAPSRQVARRKITCMSVAYDKVAGSYANALVDLAQEKNTLDTVHQDIDALSSAFKDNPSLKEFLFNPMVPADRKKDLIKKLARDVSQDTLKFMYLLVDRDRIVAIDQIFTTFQQTYCRVTDTQVVKLRAAVVMKEDQLFMVAKKLQQLTGSKNVKLQPSKDPDLIGGFVLEFGSQQIDLSIRGQLGKIENELLTGQAAFA